MKTEWCNFAQYQHHDWYFALASVSFGISAVLQAGFKKSIAST